VNAILPIIALLVLWTCASVVAADRKQSTPAKQAKVLPVSGELISIKGHEAFLIMPEHAAGNGKTAWVWYAPTLPGLPGNEEKWMFQKFLDAGIAIAGIDVGESYGSPAGRALFSSFYKELVKKRGFAKTPCLLARSRGGLMLYNWAVEHPEHVACIAGIYPVCNLCSYPGLEKACGAYALTAEQLSARLADHNPIDRLQPLARARVPIFHIHGDNDVVVPIEKNSGELARRYKELGGEITLSVITGQGHNMWVGWFESQELVDFVIAHANKKHARNARF
jgi:pimeloyl-ACP methyl ester carboxylesterase